MSCNCHGNTFAEKIARQKALAEFKAKQAARKERLKTRGQKKDDNTNNQ